jgi:hypothetical protein
MKQRVKYIRMDRLSVKTYLLQVTSADAIQPTVFSDSFEGLKTHIQSGNESPEEQEACVSLLAHYMKEDCEWNTPMKLLPDEEAIMLRDQVQRWTL